MIKLLDKMTIDKIAAGEVIERPSSIVKELLENSIDAGASLITVEIKDGGMTLIRVTDNGCGIPKEEVKTAYMRHATSKIDSSEDLISISSLGFRGEALSTIAAVSQTEMITKTSESLTGIKYVIHGGQEIEFVEVGVPDGTTIVVRNLFYNTPARKKFLKTPITEGSYINDLVLRIALSHPEIAFKLISNGQTKLDTAGNGNTKDTIYQLFGRDITSNLIEISYDDENISIEGFIGKPFISRGNRGFENYFVNDRYIKSNIINRAIEEGYRTFVMQHKFPFTVMYITLPANKCDVNVHPTKMEFKYDNEKELFEVISRAVRDALTHKEMIPKTEYSHPKKDNIPADRKAYKPAEPFEKNRQNNNQQNNNVRMAPEMNTRANKYSSTYKILEAMKNSEKDDVGIPTNMLRDEGVKYTPSDSANLNSKTEEHVKLTSSSAAINAYKQTEQIAKNIKSDPENKNAEKVI